MSFLSFITALNELFLQKCDAAFLGSKGPFLCCSTPEFEETQLKYTQLCNLEKTCDEKINDIKKEIQIINNARFYDNFDPEPEFLIQFERGSIIFRSAWEEYFSFYNMITYTHFVICEIF